MWGTLPGSLISSSSLKGEIVARYRKRAIAALAVSAVLITSTAAYAHDHNLNRRVPEGATASSMSWAYYRGELTDLSPKTDDVYDGARATAMMIGMNKESTFRVTLRGLKEAAIHQQYGAHLHVGPCGLANPEDATTVTVGGHYNISPIDQSTKLPTVISNKTEVWLNFHVGSDGSAQATAVVPFVPDGHERSITFHEKATVHHQTEGGPAVGTAGAKLACLPLEIHAIPNRD
jgi:hypothetical protein